MTSESNLSGLVKILHFKQQIFRSCGVRLKSLFVTQLNSGARLQAQCCLITVYASFRTFVTWIPGLGILRWLVTLPRSWPLIGWQWHLISRHLVPESPCCPGCHRYVLCRVRGLTKNNFRDRRVIKTHGKSFEHHTSKTYAKRKYWNKWRIMIKA